MKKIIFATAVFSCCFLTGFTGHTQITRYVPQEVKLAFDINFNEASLVSWEKIPDGYKAIFNQGKGRNDAYFGEKGEFKGVGRYIESSLLPVKIMQKLFRRYVDFLLEEIYEYTCNVDGLCYIITMHNEKVRQVVRLSPSGKLLDSERQQIKKTDDAIAWNE